MLDSVCPTAAALADFVLGKLPEDAVDAMAAHAALCNRCQETLAQLRVHDDMLIHHLRAAVSQSAYEQEQACQGAIQAIVQMAYDANSLIGLGNSGAPPADEFTGIDLATLVRRLGPLRPADACELIRLAAVALDEAHRVGVVRLEIHPAHLRLGVDGEVQVLDLGLELTSAVGASDEPTSPAAVLGTLDYMAPEQTRDSRQFDVRADIYRLGATLYKLLTGRAPFDDPRYRSPVKKLMALANEMPPSVAESRDDIPEGLVAVIERLLAKQPDERYATPLETAAALEPFTLDADIAALVESIPRDKGPATRN